MKKLAVICLKTLYLKQLTESLPKYLSRDWTIAGYGSAEEFRDAKGVPTVILATAEQKDRAAFSETWKDSTVLWLTEHEACAKGEVFMYQSVSSIAERIREACEAEGRSAPGIEAGQVLRVHGYAASEGGCGCTTEAYRRAVLMAASGKTAFLCMNRTPGLTEIPAMEGGVSELVYLLQEYGKSWTDHIRHCGKAVGALTVFAGVSRAGDEALFREEESESFIAGLREKEYRNLVIDFGTGGTEELISRCDIIWSCGGSNREKQKALERQAEQGGFRNRLRPAGSEEKPDDNIP